MKKIIASLVLLVVFMSACSYQQTGQPTVTPDPVLTDVGFHFAESEGKIAAVGSYQCRTDTGIIKKASFDFKTDIEPVPTNRFVYCMFSYRSDYEWYANFQDDGSAWMILRPRESK